MTENSKLTLTGLNSGFRLEASGTCGLMRTASSASALVGYALSTKAGKDGVPYTQIDLTAEKQVTDPPVLALSADYAQLVSYPEVDLDLRYTDVPVDTEVEVQATNAAFTIPRQKIKGSSLIGMAGEDLGEFAMALTLRLWIKNPDALKSTTALSLSFSRIERGPPAADRKVLLQKFALNLTN